MNCYKWEIERNLILKLLLRIGIGMLSDMLYITLSYFWSHIEAPTRSWGLVHKPLWLGSRGNLASKPLFRISITRLSSMFHVGPNDRYTLMKSLRIIWHVLIPWLCIGSQGKFVLQIGSSNLDNLTFWYVLHGFKWCIWFNESAPEHKGLSNAMIITAQSMGICRPTASSDLHA